MKRYAVTKFGVDLRYNEHNTPIWEGKAESRQEAINKAVEANYEPKDREWMKGFLMAHEYNLN